MNNLRIYISNYDMPIVNPKGIFILVRPFYTNIGWQNTESIKSIWGIESNIDYVNNPEEADILLIAHPINDYIEEKKITELHAFNSICKKHSIQGYGFISGDFGQAYPEFSHLTYFRMGGFKSQLSSKNIGFPVTISDYFKTIYKKNDPKPIAKQEIPTLGFCGHATPFLYKRVYELGKNILENIKRFFENPQRTDWEPLFASAFERWKLLQVLESSKDLHCQFIYRPKYRAGAKTREQLEQTTKEYYDNILQSDYVLCMRGAGNFSVRFYETLMMGKIPIFVNTDCLLPMEDVIDWKQHVVWVEWNERQFIVQKVLAFHQQLTPEAFIELQVANRNLWKNQLSVKSYLNKLHP